MYTEWKSPRIVGQYSEHESHISWDGIADLADMKHSDGRFIRTSKDLVHISNPTTNDIRSTTWYLTATDFNFGNIIPVITGIEMRLSSKRGGRVSDETIQLVFNGQMIGDNQSTPTLEMTKIYGGSNNTWGVEIVDSEMIRDSSFGITMRFQSHPYWPHKESMLIDSVAIRIFAG
jgi:hypothetical protein